MLTNIVSVLEGCWSEIAAEAGVSLIVERPLFAAPSVELVDVTELIVKRLPPADA